MRKACLIAAAGLLALEARPVRATPDEAALKAAMIYNIGRFTTWSDDRLAAADGDLVVCIEPDEALAPQLQALEGKPVGSGRLLVRRQAWPFPSACQMAYVGQRRVSDGALSGLADRGCLTVGEAPGFSRTGAIGLVRVGRHTRFEINNAAAKRAGAQLSSQLLRLAVRLR